MVDNFLLLVRYVCGEIGSIFIFNRMTEGVLPALECQVPRLSLDVFARMHDESISGLLAVSQGRTVRRVALRLLCVPRW